MRTDSPHDASPIFLIGCPRSGTTLLRLMLDSHPNISCGPETHFLIEMQSIFGRHWRRLQLFGFPRAYWLAKTAAFFDAFEMEYAARQGKRRWADKTPRYTPYIAFLDELFPDCQFVHLIRDPRDVVASHRNRWGYRAALQCAAKTWRDYVTVARDFGRGLPASRYLELRYEDLVRSPEPVLRTLLEFVGEPWSVNVLNYQDFHHDYADEQGHLERARQKKDAAGVDASRVRQGGQLDPLLALVLRRRSGALMKELDYA